MNKKDTLSEFLKFDYFETLKTGEDRAEFTQFAKVEIYGYNKLGYMIDSILTVCRQALSSTELTNQFATNLDYCNLLELASDLIPHSEMELLDKLHTTTKQNAI